LRRLPQLLSAAAAVAALAANGGGFSRRLDLLAHFTPIYAAMALAALALIGLAPGRRRRVAALALVALAGSAVLIAPEFTRDAGPTAPTNAPGQIKVIQLNALRTNTEIGKVADWLIAQHPDVVTLTETQPELRELLVRRTGWAIAGIHSPLVIFTPRHYVVMNRPPTDEEEAPSFVNATYDSASGPMEVVTAHLDWPTEAYVAGQERTLAEILGQLPRRRTILTGDFNAAPWSAEMRRLDRASGLIRRDRALPTWPAQVLGRRWPWPFVPIDHVYAGKGWATVKVERGPWLGSDHYPVVVILAPVAPP